MYLLIISLPLISSLVVGLLGFLIGRKGSIILSFSLMLLSVILSLLIFFEVSLQGSPCNIILFPWINVGLLSLNWNFFFDTLTSSMLFIVVFVSFLVHIYSYEYMSNDPHLPRFISYISLFTFFMIILITANNFLQMFIGWEGVGLCSYLLINFWYGRLQANKAALKAMFINRIGDFGLIIGIILIFFFFFSLDYPTVFSLIPFYKNNYITIFSYNINIINLICFFLFIGAVGKSAQIGLHIWLPDAMEGPTPVSALIHAATMVTAGVFLISRCSPIFEYAPKILNLMIIVGALTCFISATIGLLQNDIKKVIAYSTCSQLGYMVFACGMSQYMLSIYHLINHAFFKALLFLSAGSVIHALNDEQDMRKYGGLIQLLPFTFAMILIGSLSLAGFPFLTGYYSKDIILETAYSNYTNTGHFAYYLGVFAAFFTAFYSMRLIYLTFLSETNSFKQIIKNVHDAPILMAIPMFILSIGSIFFGYFTKDMFIGLGTSFWGNSIFILPKNILILEAEFLPITIKLLPVIISCLGLFSAYYFYKNQYAFLIKLKLNNFGYYIYNFLNKKWFFDKIYIEKIALPFLNISYNVTYKILDKGLIELLGPYGLSYFIFNTAKKVNNIHTGYIYHYALIIFLFIIFSINIFILF